MTRLLIPLALVILLTAPAIAQGRRGPDKAPKVGAKAPDFVLHRLTAKGEKSKEKVKLSEVCKKRPVALVFGSYT
ncbi:MAG: hypothetical protein JKY65_10145 [Planctomycetes bacterium]|nr:hypothetical protein [Planctomycetota bacterium]